MNIENDMRHIADAFAFCSALGLAPVPTDKEHSRAFLDRLRGLDVAQELPADLRPFFLVYFAARNALNRLEPDATDDERFSAMFDALANKGTVLA